MLAAATRNKHTRATYWFTSCHERGGKQSTMKETAAASSEHSRHLFFLLHSRVEKREKKRKEKKKQLPIYTTEHCNNVVTLTKILGSWLSLCA